MRDNPLEAEYYEWIFGLACKWTKPYGRYKKLIAQLQETTFTWIVPNDKHRASDGMSFRYNFVDYMDELGKYVTEDDVDDRIIHPCTVLEMMMALASRIENQLMWDPDLGDRSPLWFFQMLETSGLSYYTDTKYSKHEVSLILDDVLNRRYKEDGDGGFFYVENPDKDLREVELWWQCNWHMHDILKGDN